MKLIDAEKAYAGVMQLADLLDEHGNPEMAGAVRAAAIRIQKMPAAKPEPGIWTEYTLLDEVSYVCNHCRCIERKPTPFCPHCGLPMIVEEG